jgi:integrase
MARRKPWRHAVGASAPVVHVEERDAAGGRVQLRWWDAAASRSKRKAIDLRVRDAAGKLDDALVAAAIGRAEAFRDELRGVSVAPTVIANAALRWGDVWPLLTDPQRGTYPTPTTHRKAVAAAIRDARACLGESFRLASFDHTSLRQLTRWKAKAVRANGGTGFGAATQLARAVLTILRVLRADGHLPATTAIPDGRTWMNELKRWYEQEAGGVPQVAQDRYSLDELRRLLEATRRHDDPRARLLFDLGGGLRIGQVARVMRSALDREAGRLTVTGAGHKLGEVLELTPGQRAAMEEAFDAERGYLRWVESFFRDVGTLSDYPLFPGGFLRSTKNGSKVAPYVEVRPDLPCVSPRLIWEWWREIEALAGVPHVAGRASRGLRRQLVDFATIAKDVGPDVLQSLGGWASDQTPRGIYRDRQREGARSRAAEVRAELRGEHLQESAAPTRSGETDPDSTQHRGHAPEGDMENSSTIDAATCDDTTTYGTVSGATAGIGSPGSASSSSTPGGHATESTDDPSALYRCGVTNVLFSGAGDSDKTDPNPTLAALAELTAGAGPDVGLTIVVGENDRNSAGGAA